MSSEASTHPVRIDQLFAGPGARADKWRNLVELGDAWAKGCLAAVKDCHSHLLGDGRMMY